MRPTLPISRCESGRSPLLCLLAKFRRTLSSNGRGTDHGWGAHHFVGGGAVRGRNMYGIYPPIAMEHDEATSFGSLIRRSLWTSMRPRSRAGSESQMG
jgi:uncharacterized protein (DUF1501 family)